MRGKLPTILPTTCALRCRASGNGYAGPVAQVLDNGRGIPPDLRGEVFERFVRLDKSRATTGSGLGLSLVAAIAELHEAAVELTDTLPGQSRPGLKVSLRLPPVGDL